MTRGAGRGARGLAVLVGGGLIGCTSLSGLTGGTSDDGGMTRHDAASDAVVRHDAASDSASRRDAGADAVIHGGSDGGAHDAASHDAAAALTCATATLCDSFARSVVIPAGDLQWGAVLCDTDAGGTITVDGSLNISQPSATRALCFLQSYRTPLLPNPVLSVGSFQLEFDVTFDSSVTSPTVEVVDVTIFATDGSNNQEDIELLLAGDGTADLFILYSSDGYVDHKLGAVSAPGVWVLPRTKCHVALTVDAKVPSATGSSTCAGMVQALGPPDPSIPPGFAGPALVNLGYANYSGTNTPAWTLTYDSFLFRASP